MRETIKRPAHSFDLTYPSRTCTCMFVVNESASNTMITKNRSEQLCIFNPILLID